MTDFYEKGNLPGIPDSSFLRGKTPMSKEETRILTLCKARLEEGMTVYDIGAGTGSLSIEAARLVPAGQVFAVEENEEALALIAENQKKFALNNIKIIAGRAPASLRGDLPPADRVIIGGSGGALKDILDWTAKKLRPGGIVVVTSVTLDTLWLARQRLSLRPFCQLEALQVSVSLIEERGNSMMFQARNPICILRAGKED